MSHQLFDPGPLLRECPECEGGGDVCGSLRGEVDIVPCPLCKGECEALLSAHCPECASPEVEQAVRRQWAGRWRDTVLTGMVYCRDCAEVCAEGEVDWELADAREV